mmetsp:Transcript_52189/g.62823  ORF Transcript_52189/g.62823 Transcript_52189/m.62823 type:complete len:138 (-) Transcript_52189:133-546(-)|eukprot:CAMPEP_0172517306 /NCGR_PEP_ID=MMETSP1066-20121228/283964_1 /TAXON_ID=671091 /ORGANISM="Coscinodiscus wailesii, Strain CCMP2513" /LENGTH=137 /DNA_ID=CAMNT_0013299237 /DNA_START=59 /DNA_END=472 /DNA_ORIENTATION=-
MTLIMCVIVLLFVVYSSCGFNTNQRITPARGLTKLHANSNGGNNPLQGFMDMFGSMDDVIDDFMNKRMGKGEIFYGKRKYKPSGEVDGDYNGFGLSDKTRIEITQARKEEWMEERKIRMEMEELRREREMRQRRGDL